MHQRTLVLVKPDAFAAKKAGAIIELVEDAGLSIVAMKKTRLSVLEAQKFYGVHAARPFFGELTTWMASGPIVAIVWEGEDAVDRVRTLMGATDPAKAAEGTIRNLYAKSIQENAVHGSDSAENAAIEIGFFFAGRELE